MEKINCPLCGSHKSTVFLESIDIKKTRKRFKIVECSDCFFKFTNPRPTFQEIGNYYGTDYYSYQKPQFKSISINPNGQRFLDYGCGAGHTLLEKASLGYNVFGVEIDDHSIKTGKELGFNIIKARADKINFPEQYFDMIHVNHVLEHIHNLRTMTTEFHRCLKTGGTLWLEVPNVESYDAKIHGDSWGYWYLPVHLYHFNLGSLEKLLKLAGFENFEIKTINVPGINKRMDYIKSRYTVLKMKIALTNKPALRNFISALFFVGFNFFRYLIHKQKASDGNLIQVIASK